METNIYIFIISRSVLFKMRNVSEEVVEKIKTHILPSIYFFFENLTVYKIKCKNIVQPDRPQMTVRLMGIACWIPKATNTHSVYVILIVFPLQ
jgi:hypothetical protein